MQRSDMLILPLNLGKRSQNLVSKMTEYSGVVGVGAGKEYYSYYTYEYDSKGYVVKIKETTDDGSQSTAVITYQN